MVDLKNKSNDTRSSYSFENIFEVVYHKAANILLPYFVNSSVTPNQVTLVSGLFGVAGAILLMLPSYTALFFSAIFIHIYSIFDSLDGQLAKTKNLSSPFGMWLDIFFDKFNDFLLVVGLTLGVYFRTSDVRLLFLGILLMGFVFSVQFLLAINNLLFKKHMLTRKEVISVMVPSHNIDSNLIQYLLSILQLLSNHVALKHNSFLFFVALFALLNQTELGLIFMTIYAGLSLLYGLVINFIKIR
jgi:phosphatidylglycerophosphate synthase